MIDHAAGRVLIADDDPVVRVLAARALAALGFEVEEVEDGRAALEAIERARLDLVILDVEMPHLNGLEACEALRADPRTSKLPVLITTGVTDSETIDRAFSAGASDFIKKPLDWQLLQHRVRFLMRADSVLNKLSRTLADLSESRARLANAQRIAKLGNWEWVPDSEEMLWSDELYRLLGLVRTSHPPTRTAFLEAVHVEDRSTIEKAFQDAAAELTTWTIDHRIQLATNGEIRIVRQHAEVQADTDGEPERVIGTTQDITDRHRAEEQIRALSYYDTLTALPNRRMLEESLLHRMARPSARPLAMFVLNLDRFKRINDTLGFSGGDQILRAVAERLLARVEAEPGADSTQNASPVARLGSDEFAIVLRIGSSAGASAAARRILECLDEPFTVDGTEVVMSANIGIAVHPEDGADPTTLIRNANTALHHARDDGPTGYRFFRTSMNEAASRRFELESGLRSAASRDELITHFQPLWGVSSREIVGLEVLARWPSKEFGLIMPGEFIPVAEEAGLIGLISEWVLRAACRQGRRWLDEGYAAPRLSINLSSLQLRDPALFPLVDSVLNESGLPPDRLEAEITESALLADEPAVSDNLEQLKRRGVRVALDDFGTGFSSLSHLVRYPIDTLKIDQSFVHSIGTGQSGPVISALIAMAHRLKLQVVAEGVETAEQEDFLRREGCDALQGFRLAHPMPAEEMTRLLRRR